MVHYIDHYEHEFPDCVDTVCGLGFSYKKQFEEGTLNIEEVTCKKCIKWNNNIDKKVNELIETLKK